LQFTFDLFLARYAKQQKTEQDPEKTFLYCGYPVSVGCICFDKRSWYGGI